MNDTAGAQIVIAIISFLAFLLPLLLVPFAFKFAGSGMKALYQGAMNGVKSVASKASDAGKSAAKSSKYGQAAQQFMGKRKEISALKGREALRGALNSNPNLARLMGGLGGQKYASRFLDTENRKHETEQIQELSKGMTLGMANAISRKENLSKALAQGRYANGNTLEASDIAGIKRMQEQGYLDESGVVQARQPHSAVVASAALEKLYEIDDINAGNVSGLGSLLEGAGAEANAKFTQLNAGLAGKNKSKNVAYAEFTDGKMDQFKNKKPDDILASGLQGTNKDALKPSNHDLNPDGTLSDKNALLEALKKQVVRSDGSRDFKAIVERTRQTMDQSHQQVLQGLADAMGFASVDEFKALRNAISSGGGLEALPEPYRTAAMGSQAPAAPQPQPQPQLIIPHAPTGAGPSPRSRPSNFPPSGGPGPIAGPGPGP